MRVKQLGTQGGSGVGAGGTQRDGESNEQRVYSSQVATLPFDRGVLTAGRFTRRFEALIR